MLPCTGRLIAIRAWRPGWTRLRGGWPTLNQKPSSSTYQSKWPFLCACSAYLSSLWRCPANGRTRRIYWCTWLADHIVAVWPKELCVPRWLRSYKDKTSYAGGISRLDGRQIPAPRPARAQRGPFAATTVLVLGGADGLGAGPDALEQCSAAQQLAPGQRWVRRKPTGPTTRGRRCGADVVVTLAGQSCIADVAAAQRPAVIIPQRRPYDEPLATARVLRQYRLAVVVRRWPEQRAWPAL